MSTAIRHQDLDPELNELATRVIGAAIEVHRVLGPGFSENAYEDAFCVELGLQGIPFERQVRVHLVYKGVRIGEGIIDLIVAGKLIVELKAVSALTPVHEAQIISYSRITGLKLGLLINFNVAVLKDGIKRIVASQPRYSAPPLLRG